MQRARGKSSVEGAGCDILFGESSDEFHGCRGNRGAAEIIRAVENAGYGAAEKKRGGAETAGAAEAMPQEEMLKDRETPLLKKRLVTSVAFWQC